MLARALADTERGLGARGITADSGPPARPGGPLRRRPAPRPQRPRGHRPQPAGGRPRSRPADLELFARERRIRYDADEDEHYDTISAFIKSCRGGDPDAAMYWLAKMLAGGEDPRFVARRLVILASEDVGLADPQALPLAVAALHAVEFVGLPEAELTLAHATLYIATAPKSNSATIALGEAHRELAENPVQAVPLALRDKGGQASKRMGHGKGYAYSHEFDEGISGQTYLERPVTLYTPKTEGAERAIAERLARWRKLRETRAGG